MRKISRSTTADQLRPEVSEDRDDSTNLLLPYGTKGVCDRSDRLLIPLPPGFLCGYKLGAPAKHAID